MMVEFDTCEFHGGVHTVAPNNCPDCGRFSKDSWQDLGVGTQNGTYDHWGGVCSVHGIWSESSG